MSLFRKPKKIQRRVFSSAIDDEESSTSIELSKGVGDTVLDMDDEMEAPPPPVISCNKKLEKREKVRESKQRTTGKVNEAGDGRVSNAKALLSFADDEEDGEVFQVRKSSHSKKMMRMLDKERRKKKRGGRDDMITADIIDERCENGRNSGSHSLGSNEIAKGQPHSGNQCNTGSTSSTTTTASTATNSSHFSEHSKSKKSDSIQTEIRTDDFVLVVKKSEPDIILNGRAAICAGRDDMSEEDDDYGHGHGHGHNSDNDSMNRHRFSKPDHLKQMLESGSIPDAAMIHAARKRRQKARERGDFIPLEEPKETTKGSRLAREDVEGENSDDEERVDMNAITGVKEREERREQFYSVEHDYSEEDSDLETNDWESQQIRKGVTGAQLVTAQQESLLSRFMIKPAPIAVDYTNSSLAQSPSQPQSTSSLLEQAYVKNALEKPQQLLTNTKAKKTKSKMQTLRTPQEIIDGISTRLSKLKELNAKHESDLLSIKEELQSLKLEQIESAEKAPTMATKYRFYQEIKCFVIDLIDCLNEKMPTISSLEKRFIQIMSKHQTYLIERRRQDVRDQAKEMAEALKPSPSRRSGEQEEHIRRAAEREGRRTRRRCEREKNEILASHLDGMSSDDETSDHYVDQLKAGLEQITRDGVDAFDDVTDEFSKMELILMKFYAWRKTDIDSYKNAFVHLCLPKVLGPLVRLEILAWSPISEDYKDIEKMDWYTACMLYAWHEHETLETLKSDPDIMLVPSIIERIILPKLTEIVDLCWDPLSTTQTLRLIGCINRLSREFPLRETSKSLNQLFNTILTKMRTALDNDVFIPIYPKQVQEAKTSFFQRQFYSGLKLFRNFLSWQGIIADKPLRELAIASLLNRYLLMAMRVCTVNDAMNKAYVVVNTLPTVWLHPDTEAESLLKLEQLITFVKQKLETCDMKNPLNLQSLEKGKQILQRLHSY